jgi:hypothetical protein
MSKDKKKPAKKNDSKLPIKKSTKHSKDGKPCRECGRPQSTIGQDEEE